MKDRLYTGAERRQAVRFPFDAWVKVEHDGGDFEARGTDFNDEFIRIVEATPLEAGTEVKVSVVDEVGNHVLILGEVFRSGKPDAKGACTMVIRRTSEPVAAEPPADGGGDGGDDGGAEDDDDVPPLDD